MPAGKAAGKIEGGPLEQPEETGQPQARSLRGYGGIRITAPPRAAARKPAAGYRPPPGDAAEVSAEKQVRILTGAALLGILVTILLHELGHWAAGFALTGRAPDFYVVAVRQKTTEITGADGAAVWLAGPVMHLAAIWAFTLLAPLSQRYGARLAAAAGGATLFTLLLIAFTWAMAAASGPVDWHDDLPKVATFFSSRQWLWMHVLNLAFLAGVAGAALFWWRVVGARLSSRMFYGPIAVGTIQGVVIVVIGSVLVAMAL